MKTIPIVLLFFISFVFANCSDEPSCPEEGTSYYYVNDSRKSLIPYKDIDSIRFTDNNNISISFLSNEIKHRFSEVKKRDPNPDCNVYQTEKYEVLQYVFYNETKNDSIFLQLESMNGYCTFIGNKSTFFFTHYAFKSLNSNFDSILLSNKWYYNHSTLINQQLDTLIINKDYGILKCVNYTTGKSIIINK